MSLPSTQEEARADFFDRVKAADEWGDYRALRLLANEVEDDDELAASIMQMAMRHWKAENSEDLRDERDEERYEQHRDWLAEY